MNPCPWCGFDNELTTGFCHDCLGSLGLERTCEYRDEHFETLRAASQQAYRSELSPTRLRVEIATQRARVLESMAELDDAMAGAGERNPENGDAEGTEMLARVQSHMQGLLLGLDGLEQFCHDADACHLEQGLAQVERATRALNLALMS